MDTTDPKSLVRRLVDQVINGADPDALEALCTPRLASNLRRAFSQFRDAFSDWHQDVVELVAESDTVVARFRCAGTHRGPWRGGGTERPTDASRRGLLLPHQGGRIAQVWGLEDT
jgi:predicted ester cyclase